MDHAKKLMLVEPKLYRPSMRRSIEFLTKLDKDIEKTLNSDLPDSEKANKYIEALRRYKHYELPQPQEERVDTETEILSTVPSGQRHKAKRLLDHLKRDADVRIGDKGEFIYKQQKLHQSHVGDLLNDVLQKKSSAGESPLGWREFSDTLKTLKVPKDLVENTDRWKYMYPPEKKKVRRVVITPNRAPRSRKRASVRGRWLGYDDEQ